MKNFLYGSLLGIIIGGSGTTVLYLLLNKSTPVVAEMKIASSDPLVKISGESLEVKNKRNTVEVIASFETDRKGTYTNIITIDRRKLQYKHSIYAETGYWVNSQIPYFSLSYSYEWLLISAKVGYSLKLNIIDHGIGIGYKLSF